MIKLINSIIVLMFLTGCSNSVFTSVDPANQCYPERVDEGVTFRCKDGSTFNVNDGETGESGKDGTDGSDGINGQDGLFVNIIDPCGKESRLDEVILETVDGEFLAYFAGSSTTSSRLTILEENVNYITTDGTGCRFSIVSGELVEL